MLASVAMLGLTLLIGEENGGAKNWIDLGFLSIQPSEFVKVALVLCLAMGPERAAGPCASSCPWACLQSRAWD